MLRLIKQRNINAVQDEPVKIWTTLASHSPPATPWC
ncbi:hypothetical protein AZE42_14074 [Rhizopogon vesiculosus]|uniref:Uncharacterized protein n=1 Tax=Rhizopogon vesiculosus TaxID=180088 RepID=A0A1J8QJL1_9AGAM|nr:hypothetical protein AZE42_14074 [Rhizopogon vesiculosus]